MDAKDANCPTTAYERDVLHKLYKSIPTHEDFLELKKAHFQEIFQRRLNQKRPKNQVDTSVL